VAKAAPFYFYVNKKEVAFATSLSLVVVKLVSLFISTLK
jgi:hypothetical protein